MDVEVKQKTNISQENSKKTQQIKHQNKKIKIALRQNFKLRQKI